MLLKLVVRYGTSADITIHRGSVIGWHKSPGDPVRSGDPLCDLRAETLEVPESVARLGSLIEQVNRQPSQIGRLATASMDRERVEIPELHTAAGRRAVTKTTLFLRVIAAEAGVLRRIRVREGEQITEGDVLALLTTLASDPVPEPPLPASLRVFRTTEDVRDDPGTGGETRSTDEPEPSKMEGSEDVVADKYIVLPSPNGLGAPLGIYVYGTAYLNSIFACVPHLRKRLRRGLGIYAEGPLNLCSDLMLQSLDRDFSDWPSLLTRVGLRPEHYQVPVFESRFRVRVGPETKVVAKDVVVLSILPDVETRLFQHRETGYLFDPYAVWRNPEIRVLLADGTEPELTDELADRFDAEVRSLGLVPVERFADNMARLVPALRDAVGARVLVCNTLGLGSADGTHSYGLVRGSRGLRRLEFNLALYELSRTLDVPVLDLDRILKRAGISTQFSWDAMDPRLNSRIGHEIARILEEHGLVSATLDDEEGERNQ